jgi:hypothetical protein
MLEWTLVVALLMSTGDRVIQSKPVVSTTRCQSLEGAWSFEEYTKGTTTYKTTGVILFTKNRFAQMAFFNKEKGPDDYSEAHHGRYTLRDDYILLDLDVHMHMDPKDKAGPVRYDRGLKPFMMSCSVDSSGVVSMSNGSGLTTLFSSPRAMKLRRIE